MSAQTSNGTGLLGGEEDAMPKFVIERDILGIGSLPPPDLQGAADKSNGALRELGPQIQWLESFVTKDKTYCIYLAPSKDLILKHAELSGFPANRVEEVRVIIDPTTAES
jgi:hypothetical protein